jgi:beta-galactosidase
MRRTPWNDGWEFRPKVSRFLELAGQSTPWAPIAVPHDAMLSAARSPTATAASGYHHGGTYEYRKPLRVPADRGAGPLLLELEAVYRDATVAIDGQVVAHRPYGYSPIVVDLAPYVRAGETATIVVEARAGDDSRWYSGAGIYRDVWLATGGPVHVALDGVRVTTPDVDDRRATVVVATRVVNDSDAIATIDVVTELVDADGTIVARDVAPVPVAARTDATVRQRMLMDQPERWDVEHPYLYSCRTAIRRGDDVLDEARTTFGIRTVAVDAARGLRINGATVDLRGACIHHDSGVIGAATFARAEERRVERLQHAGFNALRSAHNPMSRAMLDACDRLGMLVMDEAFDMWTRSKTDDDYARSFADWWDADLAAMVDKDFNHPSVIMYSTGNEILELGTDVGVLWSRRLAEAIRARDDTRIVTSGVQALFAAADDLADIFASTATDIDPEAGVNTQMAQIFERMATAMQSDRIDARISPAFATLDVAGYNYLEARYDVDHERHPNRVILGSENHPPMIDRNWQYVETHGHVIGDFTWTGWDYLGEAGIGRVAWPGGDTGDVMSGFLGPYPWLVAWCGDIDITGARRPVSYYREIVFGRRAEPYLAVERPGHVGQTPTFSSPWSWSDTIASWTWPGHDGEPMRVEVYSGDDEVELVVNGRSIGRAPAGPQHRYRAEFEIAYEPGELLAVAYGHDGRERSRTALRSAIGDVCLRVEAERAQVAGDGRDLAYVDVTLVDAHGTVDTSADRRVTIAIDGPGVLQGFGSANPRTEERFTNDVHTTFDGHALAVIRPTGAGAIRVTVTAEECDAATATVRAR